MSGVGRPKNYRTYDKLEVFEALGEEFMTTQQVVLIMKRTHPRIHWYSVNRLLKDLEDSGLIRQVKVSSFYVWGKL